MLNYSNKALFGRVNARANVQPTPSAPPPLPEITEPKSRRNDISSEMFWLLHHKANGPKQRVDPTTVGAKAPKKRRAPIQYAAADIELLRSLKPSKKRKNTKLYTQDRAEFVHPEADRTIPSSLSRFGDTLCDPPVRNLSALVAPPPLLKRSSNDALNRMLAVPAFRTDGQPIGGSGDDDGDGEVIGVGVGATVERLAVRDMPSVGKVLQATMPEASRRALMNWKQLKVAELGIDGFHELQQCKRVHGIGQLLDNLSLNRLISQLIYLPAQSSTTRCKRTSMTTKRRMRIRRWPASGTAFSRRWPTLAPSPH